MRTKVSAIPLQSVSKALLAVHSRFYGTSLASGPWICQQCRNKSTYRAILLPRQTCSRRRTVEASLKWRNEYGLSRSFSTSHRAYEESITTKSSEQHELPSKQEFRRSKASKQLSHMMDNIQSNVFVAGQRLNDLTGYSAIEALKKEIEVQGLHHRDAHEL